MAFLHPQARLPAELARHHEPLYRSCSTMYFDDLYDVLFVRPTLCSDACSGKARRC